MDYIKIFAGYPQTFLADKPQIKTPSRKPSDAPRSDLYPIRRTLVWSRMNFYVFTRLFVVTLDVINDQIKRAEALVYRRKLCYTGNPLQRRDKMGPQHFNVIIATPGKAMLAAFVKSLMYTAELLGILGITFRFVNQYSPIVSQARELTAMGRSDLSMDSKEPFSREYTYDKLFWIDSDIEWDPYDFVKLYESELDIVSGVYLTDNRVLTFRSDHSYEETVELINSDVPFEVDRIGLGFVCFKNGVFESIPRPWFNSVIEEKTTDGGYTYQEHVGEDYSFSIKALEAGYRINVHPQVRLKHHKTQVIEV